jgi:predicted transcriptional regulator
MVSYHVGKINQSGLQKGLFIMLGKQDTKTFHLFNEILALLANGEMMLPAISDALGMEHNGALNRMKCLVADGFVHAEKREQGWYRQKTWFYTAIRNSYPRDEFEAKIELRHANHKSYKNKPRKPIEIVVKPATPSHIYVFNIDEKREGKYIHQDKFNEQAKSIKKHFTYGVTGSSMAMI